MVIGRGFEDRFLTESETRDLMSLALGLAQLDGRRILVIIPDRTRTAPIPLMFRLFFELLRERAAQLDYLIALGTHKPLSEDSINQLIGVQPDERAGVYGGVRIFNHQWNEPDTFVSIGVITSSEISELTGGLMKGPIDVRLNRKVLDYDLLIICGPTFPHEVVGFSGGNKYSFPGVGGAEVINFSHWLGALITSYSVIGSKDTPVRRVIDKAASLIDSQKMFFSLVVKDEGLAGLYAGSPEEAYSAAADLSAKLHIRCLEKTFKRVRSVTPPMYEDVWTAAKGMYKLEPVVEDGEKSSYTRLTSTKSATRTVRCWTRPAITSATTFCGSGADLITIPAVSWRTAPTCAAWANSMRLPALRSRALMSRWPPESPKRAAAG